MTSRPFFALVGTLALAGLAIGSPQAPEGKTPPVDPAKSAHFEAKIRPLLLAKCVGCHGGKEPSAGLRLDQPVSAKVAEEIRNRVNGVVGKDPMPPTGKLPEREVAEIGKWVADGAVWPASENNSPKPGGEGALPGQGSGSAKKPTGTHWAFVPPKATLPPPVEGAETDIDAYLRAKSEKLGLTSSPEADRHTLLRRLSFDLTGLPPSAAEMDAFLADKSPDAYEKQVDRLLAQKTFGQRWARHWLDVARYADSNGLDENLAHGNAWRYRDWVVDALNADVPYDRFLTEQLAGDLLVTPQTDDTERNQCYTATGFLTLGPKVLAEQDKPKLVMDIVDEQIDVVSKATMGMTISCARCHDHKFDPISTKDYYALAGIFKSTKTMANLGFVSRWNERALASKSFEAEKKAYEATLAPLKTALDSARKSLDSALSGEGKAVRQDAIAYKTGKNVGKGNYGANSINSSGTPTEVSWELAVPTGGKWKVFLRYAAEESRPVRLSVNDKQVSDKAAGGVTGGWQEDDQRWEEAGTVTLSPGLTTLAIRRDGGPIPHFGAVLLVPADARGPKDEEEAVRDAQKALKLAQEKAPEQAMVMAVEEDKPIDVPVHRRGSTLDLGDVVPRGFPAVMCGGKRQEVAPSEGSGRLAFAKWLTRAEHPLTARVAVNRVWQHLFGEGIVASSDNWGVRGTPPSHPELLDHLALTFATEDNWSQKKLIRRLVLTQAYRQSAAPVNRKSETLDPENRLLSHANRRRLEAEPLRDAMHFVAGDLDVSLGGTLLSTKNGDYVTNDQSANQANYDAPRRGLYLPIIRNAVCDFLQAFDFGDPSLVNAKRPATIVAPQALFLLNSPLARNQAKVFAESLPKAMAEPARVREVYRRAFQRAPFPYEADRAEDFLRRSRNAGLNDTDAWAALCQTLMASNEFLYLD